MTGKHIERYGEKHDVRLDIWAPNTPNEKIINSWLDNQPESITGQKVPWAGAQYHNKVEFVLQSPGGGANTGGDLPQDFPVTQVGDWLWTLVSS